MPGEPEVPLGGGGTEGVVRVGATVRRPGHARSAYVHEVLRHLEAVGFTGAPRLLGVDEHGRDVLTYIDGEVVAWSPYELSDARIAGAASLIRAFHDATAGTAVARGQEVVCHCDLGPHNTIYRGDDAIAIIDWDEDVRPGPRLHDVADAVLCFADIGTAEVPVGEQARRARLWCDAYGWEDGPAVIEQIGIGLRRARDNHLRAGRRGPAEVFATMLAWHGEHAAELGAALDAPRQPLAATRRRPPSLPA